MHGYLSSGKSFYKQIEYFKNNFNVYYPDLTGFGENKFMPYPYSLSDYAKEVYDYIKENGLKNPCVIAHSFGGRVATKLASEHTELFSKMVLCGSAGLKPKLTFKKAIKKGAFNILKKFVPKERLSRFYSKDYNALPSVMKESFKLIVSEHLDGVLEKIKTPTLVVYGKHDKETPPYMAKRFNKGIKNSLILELNAGHFCFIDKPHEFNMEVKEFLLS